MDGFPGSCDWVSDLLTRLSRIFRSRYVLLLESRVADLELENRALRNSIYARAWMAPVDYTQPGGVAPAPKLPQPIRRVVSWAQMKQKLEQEAARHAQSGRGAVAERSGNHA